MPIINTSVGRVFQNKKPTGNLVCFVGTSLIQQNHRGASTYVRAADRSFISWAQGLSNFMFECPVWHDNTIVEGWEPSSVPNTTRHFWGFNAGVSGQTILQIYDRLDKICKIPADVYVVDAGTNDIATQTAEYIHHYRKAIAREILTRTGSPVIMLPILARDQATWDASSEAYARQQEVNRLTNVEIARMEGVSVYDWNNRWVDQDSHEEYPRAGATMDGTHFDTLGAYWVAKDFIKFIAHFVTGRSHEIGGANMLGNDLLEGTAGSNTNTTGDVSDGYRFERSAGAATGVASKAVDIHGRNVQRITLTPTGTTGESLFYFRTNAADTVADVAGQWVCSETKLSVTSANDSIIEITVFLDDTSVAEGLQAEDGAKDATNNFPAEPFTRHFKTPTIKFSNLATSFRWRIEIRIDDTKTNAVSIDIQHPIVHTVQDPTVRYNTSSED